METDLNPAALQYISVLVHILLAFQIGQDLTKDKFDTAEKKHAVSLHFTFLACLLLFPELPLLLRQMSVEHGMGGEREREELNQLAGPAQSNG